MKMRRRSRRSAIGSTASRWRGESPRVLRQSAEFPTLADLRRAWAEVEAGIRDFIRGCDDARLAADLTYTNTKGGKFTLPLGHLMLHLANHGAHHRGELVSMLAVIQIPHPETGLLGYFIEKARGGV